MDSLTGMSVFVRVADAKSLSIAARQLGVTPSAISKTLAKFEAHLGVQLLHRTTRQVNLTEDGRGFYERCRRILAEVRDAETAVHQSSEVPRGRVRVAAPEGVGRALLLPAVPELLSQHPGLTAAVVVASDAVDLIGDGFDVAVTNQEHGADTSLVQRRLGAFRRGLFASPEYLRLRGMPQGPAALTEHDCVCLERENGWRLRCRDGELVVTINPRVTTNSSEALLALALAGQGISCLLEAEAWVPVQRGELLRVLDGHDLGEEVFYALCPPSAHPAPRQRVVLEWLGATFAKAAHRLN